MISPDEIALREELATACAPLAPRWPDFWYALYEKDVAHGRIAAWAAPRWFEERLPAPWLNDVGREFESARFLDQIRKGAAALYEMNAYTNSAAWRARGYRNLFHPGDFFGAFMHGFAREGVDYALDKDASDLVMRLLGEQHGYLQEIEHLQANAAVRELSAGSLTPPALMLPPGGEMPKALRNPAVSLVADSNYLRSRAGSAPRLVADADAFESLPDLYQKLVPEICGWKFDKRASRKDRDVFSDGGGGKYSWALQVERPSARDLRFPQLVLCSSERKTVRLVLPGCDARQILEFSMSPRGHEVNLRQQWARFEALMEFYGQVLK